MNVTSNILTILVLMIIFLIAFVIVSNQSLNFMQTNIEYRIQGFNQNKISSDIDSVLNISEPVSDSTLAMLLADSIYYRRAYFEYNTHDLEVTDEITTYYNDSLFPEGDQNFVMVDKFVELVFDKLYGKENYFLEIKPKILKLRLFFVLDGSPSIENEAEQLKSAIPGLIEDFNVVYDVSARVYVLAGETLMAKVDPCADFLANGIECDYVYKEELYTDSFPSGWLTYKRDGSGYLETDVQGGFLVGSTWHNESSQLNNSALNSAAQLNTELGPDWFITADEFLDEQYAIDTEQFTLSNGSNVELITKRFTMMWCSWILMEALPTSFEVRMDFTGNNSGAKFWLNGFGQAGDNHEFVDATDDVQAGWNKLCFGYWPNPKEENNVNYAVRINDLNVYFSQSELYAFKSYPHDYNFIGGDLILEDLNGIFYEDWATGSVYAAMQADTETPSVFTAIIPISDELATGSENDACFNYPSVSTEYGFCMACNKIPEKDPLDCPIERADLDVNRAAKLIRQTGYVVFPVLANSCDIEDWMGYSYNGYCRAAGYNPYSCAAADLCGQCFGADTSECPGLTVEAGIGCDKIMCRDFIKEDMNYLASETYGQMIELTELEVLQTRIEESIRNTIEKFTIRSGTKRLDDERYAIYRVVPLSNRLYADFTLWLYKDRLQ